MQMSGFCGAGKTRGPKCFKFRANKSDFIGYKKHVACDWILTKMTLCYWLMKQIRAEYCYFDWLLLLMMKSLFAAQDPLSGYI